MEYISTLGINGIDLLLFTIMIIIDHRRSVWKKKYKGLVSGFLTPSK
jgi:hypothetical protein